MLSGIGPAEHLRRKCGAFPGSVVFYSFSWCFFIWVP